MACSRILLPWEYVAEPPLLFSIMRHVLHLSQDNLVQCIVVPSTHACVNCGKAAA